MSAVGYCFLCEAHDDISQLVVADSDSPVFAHPRCLVHHVRSGTTPYLRWWADAGGWSFSGLTQDDCKNSFPKAAEIYPRRHLNQLVHLMAERWVKGELVRE